MNTIVAPVAVFARHTTGHTAPDDVRRGEPRNMKRVPLILTGTVLGGMGFALSEPVRGLMDWVVTILTVR